MLSLWSSVSSAVSGSFSPFSPVHQDTQGLRGFSHAPASAAQQQAVIAQAKTIVDEPSATQQAREILQGMGFGKRESLALAQTLYPDALLPPDVSAYPQLVRTQEEVSGRLAAYTQLATHGEQALESTFAEVGCCLKDETKQGVRQELQALQKRDAPVASALPAQIKAPTDTWVRLLGSAGDDTAQSITASVDGGFGVFGYTEGAGAGLYDFLIAKLNASGEPVWIKTLGGAAYDYATSITAMPDGGFVVAGYTSSAGAGVDDALIVKLDSNGEPVWAKTLGSAAYDYAVSVTATSDGGVGIAGYIQNDAARTIDWLIAKLDANGNKVWMKRLNGAGSDVGTSIVATSDGGFVVAGYTTSAGAGNQDFLILKLDSNGNKLWARTVGGANNEQALLVTPTLDGGYVVTGYTESAGVGDKDLLVVRLDGNGNKVWVKTLGGVGEDVAYSIKTLSDGSFVVVGNTASAGAGGNDFLIAKLDANGNKVWCRTLGGAGADTTFSVAASPDGGFAVVGRTNSAGGGQRDVLIAKLDADGNIDGCSWLQEVTARFTQTTPTWVSVINTLLTLVEADASLVLADAGLIVQDVHTTFATSRVCFGSPSPSVTPSPIPPSPTPSVSPSRLPSITPSPSDYPVLVNGEVSAQTLLVGEPFQFVVPLSLFTDAGAAVIQLSARQANEEPLPTWLQFNPATRRFSGTPLSGSQGELALLIDGSDGHHVATVPFNLQILDQTPLLAVGIADQSAIIGKPFSFVVPATTFIDPDGDRLQLRALQATGISLPAWLSQRAALDDGNPTIELFGLPSDVGVTNIRVTASDGFGKSASTEFSIFTETKEQAKSFDSLVGVMTGVGGGLFTLMAALLGYSRREARLDPYLRGPLTGLRYIQGLDSFEGLRGDHLERILKRIELTYEDDARVKHRGVIKRISQGDHPYTKIFRVNFTTAINGQQEQNFEVRYGGSQVEVRLDGTEISPTRIAIKAVRTENDVAKRRRTIGSMVSVMPINNPSEIGPSEIDNAQL